MRTTFLPDAYRVGPPESSWQRLGPHPVDPKMAYGYEVIGRLVFEGRRHLGLSQRQLATLCGLNQSTISRLEHGQLRYLRFRTLAVIFGVLYDPHRSRWN